MEEFVNFKISSKLRAKGFNVECSHYYWVENKNLYKCYPSQDWNQKRDKYSAPNISQVLDWLREEKKIYVCIIPFATHATIDKIAFFYHIVYGSNGITMNEIEQDIYSIKWEKSAIAAIKYVVNNLI